MPSLRAQLATRYALTLLATTGVFGFGVFVAHRSAEFGGAEQRAALRADVAIAVLKQELSAITVTADTGKKRIQGQDTSELIAQLNAFLEPLPGFLVVVNLDGTPLYQSSDARYLSEGALRDSSTGTPFPSTNSAGVADSIELENAMYALLRGARSAVVSPDQQAPILIVEKRLTTQRYGALRVVAGVGAPTFSSELSELGGAILLVLPIILGISIYAGYTIADRALQPLGSLTSEVTAITDGTSLHRRLPVVSQADELARLTLQLNSMIARLETSFAALRRFTADASHELKTPLAVLRADVERAMHTPQHSHEQLVALEEALQETARMADLVESLLTLARFDEGRFDLLRERVSLEPIVREVFETALILGENARLNVTMPLVDDVVVLGDRTRLRQLFLNLVTNAIKYTPRGGDVVLTLAASEHDVVFTVRDTGIGISAADLPYVFERFWRADRARSRVGERGGFGLGLAIGQWIAQAHGGTLSVQSRLHRGSTFTVTLPLAPPESEESPDEDTRIRAEDSVQTAG